MVMTNYLGNEVLQTYFSSATSHYLALHAVNPTSLGLGEISGGSYARKNLTWTAPSSRTVANSNIITYMNLPVCTVTYFAVWDSVAGGNCLYTVHVGTISIASGGTLTVPINDLAIQLS